MKMMTILFSFVLGLFIALTLFSSRASALTQVNYTSGNITEDMSYWRISITPREVGFLIKWSSAEVPADVTINGATMCLGNETMYALDQDATIRYINNFTWAENLQPQDIATSIKSKLANETNITMVQILDYTCFNVTSQVRYGYELGHKNFTFMVEDPDNYVTGYSDVEDSNGIRIGHIGNGVWRRWEDRENSLGTGRYAYLQFDYTEAADSTSPVINITYPQNTTYNTQLSTLNYYYLDDNPDSCWYSLDGGTNNETPQQSGTNFTSVNFSEGSSFVSVYCNDTYGNLGQNLTHYTMLVAPTINVTGVDDNEGIFTWFYNNIILGTAYGASFIWTWVIDLFDVGGIDSYQVNFTNGSGDVVASFEGTGNESYFNVTEGNITQGTYNLTIRANDTSGNEKFESYNFSVLEMNERTNWAIWNGTGEQNDSKNVAVRMGYNTSVGGFVDLRDTDGEWYRFSNYYTYAEMWYHNHTATALAFGVDGLFYNLTFSNSLTNGFAFNNAGDYLEAQVKGVYKAGWMASGSGENNHEYYTSIFVNSVNIDQCEAHKKMSAGGDIVTMIGSCIFRLNVGDRIKLATADIGDTSNGNFYSANLNLVRIGV